MTAGHLRDRVIVERAAALDDGYGNPVSGGWATILTVWADMMERPGSEKIASGAVSSSRMATIRVRRSAEAAAITPADRLIARGEAWNIRGIAAVGRARELIEWTCEAGVAT